MKTSLSLSASLVLFSTAAVANPVMTVEELHAQRVGDSHVKLTYTTNYSGDPAATYGTSHSPWVQASWSVRDLGSGMQSIPIMEMCDCHVPTGGTLSYTMVRPNGTSLVTAQVSSGSDPTLPSTLGDCMSACRLADAPAADAGGSDSSGSTGGSIAIDAPVSTGGTTATGGASGTGGVIAVDTDPSTGGTTAAGGAPGAAEPDKSKGAGCAFLAPGTSPALLCLALLGLGIAGRRRRP